MGKLADLSGQRFGRWIVLGPSATRIDGRESWLCRCDCGTVRVVLGKSLKSGRSKSCGCISREKASLRMTVKHQESGFDGRGRTRLYRIWIDIKRRCQDPRHLNYLKYGARGIGVCQEWSISFDSFREWSVCHGYSDQMTIDRIDNEKGYSPENCRWVTMRVQCNNKRNNNLIEFKGKVHTLSQWAEITGINRSTISRRICKLGWPVERALTEPVKK